MSRLCEEFHCLPSSALKEWESAPCGLLETVMEFRAFASAKAIYDRAETEKDIPKTPIFQLVRALDFERVAADRQARLERAAQAERINGG